MEESRGKEVVRKCPLHSLECKEFLILQKLNSETEEHLVNVMPKNQEKVVDDEGKIRIKQTVTYKTDNNILFNPQHSNRVSSGKQSKSLIAKAMKKGAHQDLVTKIEEVVHDKVLVEIPPEKYQEIQ